MCDGEAESDGRQIDDHFLLLHTQSVVGAEELQALGVVLRLSVLDHLSDFVVENDHDHGRHSDHEHTGDGVQDHVQVPRHVLLVELKREEDEVSLSLSLSLSVYRLLQFIYVCLPIQNLSLEPAGDKQDRVN